LLHLLGRVQHHPLTRSYRRHRDIARLALVGPPGAGVDHCPSGMNAAGTCTTIYAPRKWPVHCRCWTRVEPALRERGLRRAPLVPHRRAMSARLATAAHSGRATKPMNRLALDPFPSEPKCSRLRSTSVIGLGSALPALMVIGSVAW